MKQLKRFYQLIFQKPWIFTFHSFLLILATILVNTRPFFIGWITNLATDGQINTIFNALLIMGGVLILANLVQNLGQYLLNKNMIWLSGNIINQVMVKIHQLDFAFHTNKSSGKLISLFNRGDNAIYSFYDGINGELLTFGIGFLMMFTSFARLSFVYGALVFLFALCSGIAGWFILKQNLKTREKFNQQDESLTAVKVDNLINFDTVKYFANEKYEQQRLSKVVKKWEKALNDYFLTFRSFDLIIYNLANIFTVIIGLVALGGLANGSLNAGDFLFLLTFSITILPQMAHILYVFRDLAKHNDDLERYLGILDEEEKVPDPVCPQTITNFPGEIVFDRVAFAYNRKNPVVKDFNLNIKPGEAIALVGFSGAGKTTIAKLLMRMYDVTGGKITIDGVDLRDMNKDYLRSLIGIVPQEPLMFNNSVYYNIAYSRPDAGKKDVLRASKLAQTDAFIDKLSDGYDTIVGERGIKLSGGQRQRLAIARVLLQGAQIVIFDEATSSLDSQAEKAVQDSFWQMAKNQEHPVTSIIIAHRLSTIMRADRIVVIDKGNIAEIGTHRQLLDNPKSIYTKLWRLQQDGFIGDGE